MVRRVTDARTIFAHERYGVKEGWESNRLIQRLRRVRERNHPDLTLTLDGFTPGAKKRIEDLGGTTS